MKAILLGDKIRNRRIELGMTQSELAEKVGLSSNTTVCKVEANERGIPLSKLKPYAEALDVSINYLIGDNKAYEEAMSHPERFENDKSVENDLIGSLRGIISLLTNSEKSMVLEYAQHLYRSRNEKKD